MQPTSTLSSAPSVSQHWGASVADWQTLQALGLGPDLLPVVSDPAAKISPMSKMKGKGKGKTPSKFNPAGDVVGFVAWTKHRATEQELKRWANDSRLGICLQTRQVKAIDIDIADPVHAQEVEDLVTMALGRLPMRGRTNSGKRLLLLWLPVDFPKRVIKTQHGIIELLSTGQQFIAVGAHYGNDGQPSGARYVWPAGLPTTVPEVSMAELDACWQGLVDVFALPDGASTARNGMVPTVARRAADLQDPLVAWLDENGHVTGYERDGRVHVRCPWEDGHSVDSGPSSSTVFPAGVGGFAQSHYRCLHASCSARTDGDFLEALGYVASEFDVVELTDEQACEAAAAAIRNAKRPAPVGPLESQRQRAVRIGREGSHKAPTQRVMTGTEMLEGLVFIADGSRVSFADEPRAVLPFEEFKRAYAGSVETAKNAAGRMTKVHRATMWLEHPERKTVRCQTFAPGRPAFCMSPENVLAQNLWLPRQGAAPANWHDLAEPFFQHVTYLVPDPAECERFLDWMAHIVQDPGTLPSTHYLLVARQTGIGRNWLAYALARVFAGHTALGFDLGEALRSGFNGALSQTLLAVVDELHEGGPGGPSKPAAEKLKSMLTEATRRVNPKYGRQHVEFNCTRFLMFSNHEAALPLADNDRRVVVLENPSQRRGADYYKRLYELLEHPDLGAALAEAFRRRDISRFNPGEVAPMSAAKAKTIRAGRSEIEQAVRDVAADWPADCITSGALTMEVSQTLGGKTWNVQSACVAAGLVKYPQRVRVAGVPAHVWVLRNTSVWISADSRQVKEETERGMQENAHSEFA